jgi:hypothetical protein
MKKPTTKLTAAEQKQATAEGWGVFLNTDTSKLEIQRLDEEAKFKSDDEAVAFITAQAEGGSALHVKALQIVPQRELLTVTEGLRNSLVKMIETRCIVNGVKKGSKRHIHLQAEILIAACHTLDYLNGTPATSSVTPEIYFSILRGDLLTEKV